MITMQQLDRLNLEDHAVSVRAAQSEVKGALAENLARARLTDFGFANVRKQKGKWAVIRWQRRPEKGQNGIAEVVPDKDQRLFGDWGGIWPRTGQACRFEVKAYDNKLQYSALKKHQVQGLADHTRLNGLSFLVWVNGPTVYVMKWPIIGFKPGTSLNPTAAYTAHNYTLKGLGIDHMIDRSAAAFSTIPTESDPTAQPPAAALLVCQECESADLSTIPHGDRFMLVCNDCGIGSYI